MRRRAQAVDLAPHLLAGDGTLAELSASQTVEFLERKLEMHRVATGQPPHGIDDRASHSERATSRPSQERNVPGPQTHAGAPSVQEIGEQVDGEIEPLALDRLIADGARLTDEEVERRREQARERTRGAQQATMADVDWQAVEARALQAEREAAAGKGGGAEGVGRQGSGVSTDTTQGSLTVKNASVKGGLQRGFLDRRKAQAGKAPPTPTKSPRGIREEQRSYLDFDSEGSSVEGDEMPHRRGHVAGRGGMAAASAVHRRSAAGGATDASCAPFRSFSALPQNPRRFLEPDRSILKGSPSNLAHMRDSLRSRVSFNARQCVVEPGRGAHLEESAAVRLGPTVSRIDEVEEFEAEGGDVRAEAPADAEGAAADGHREGPRPQSPPPACASPTAQRLKSGKMSLRDLLRAGCSVEEEDAEGPEEQGAESGGAEAQGERWPQAFTGVVMERPAALEGPATSAVMEPHPESAGVRVSRFKQQRAQA